MKAGKSVKCIRMDNGGENKLLVKRLNSKDWKLYPKIEYTARDTPQHNHLVEVGFATIGNQARALMNAANVPLKSRYKVWYKAVNTATKLDGLVPVTINGETKTRDEHWCGRKPKFTGPWFTKALALMKLFVFKAKFFHVEYNFLQPSPV